MRIGRLTGLCLAASLASVALGAGATGTASASSRRECSKQGSCKLIKRVSVGNVTKNSANLVATLSAGQSATSYTFVIAAIECKRHKHCEAPAEEAVVAAGSVPAGSSQVTVGYEDTQLTSGVRYEFWVEASNSGGASELSRARPFKTR